MRHFVVWIAQQCSLIRAQRAAPSRNMSVASHHFYCLVDFEIDSRHSEHNVAETRNLVLLTRNIGGTVQALFGMLKGPHALGRLIPN